MKGIKKKVSKILLSLTMVFAMALTIMPTNVFATTYLEPDITINWNEGGILELPTNTSITVKFLFDKTYSNVYKVSNIFSQTDFDEYDVNYAIATFTTGNAITNDSSKVAFYTDDGQLSMIVHVVNASSAYSLTVNDGTSEKAEYAKDETVTITADAPATGKQFKEWTVVSGGVTLADPTSAETTFTMPENDVEVTATYEDIPHTHTPTTAWSKDATNHWHDCTAGDGEKMDLDSHTFGEWVVDTQATETDKGSKHRDCTVCGQSETGDIPALGTTPEKPTITAGAGSIHQISTGKDMTLTCSGKLEDLTGIYVDGILVDDSNYTLKSGSTILTLKASYLDTLSAGKHTLKFQYKDDVSAETEFTITAKAGETPVKPSSPQTGDTSNTMLYFAFIALSGCVAGFGFKKKKSLNK